MRKAEAVKLVKKLELERKKLLTSKQSNIDYSQAKRLVRLAEAYNSLLDALYYFYDIDDEEDA